MFRGIKDVKIAQPKLKTNLTFNFFQNTIPNSINNLKYFNFRATTPILSAKRFYSKKDKEDNEDGHYYSSMGGNKSGGKEEEIYLRKQNQRAVGTNAEGKQSELFVFYDWDTYDKQQAKNLKAELQKQQEETFPAEYREILKKPAEVKLPTITPELQDQVFNVYKYYERNFHTFRLGNYTFDRFLLYLALVFLILAYYSFKELHYLEDVLDYSDELEHRDVINNRIKEQLPSQTSKIVTVIDDPYSLHFFNNLLINVGLGSCLGFGWSYARTHYRYVSFKLHNENYFKFFDRAPLSHYVALKNARRASIVVGFVSSVWCIIDYLHHLYQSKYTNLVDIKLATQLIFNFSMDTSDLEIYIAGEKVREELQEMIDCTKQSTAIVRAAEFATCIGTTIASRYCVLPLFATAYFGKRFYNFLNIRSEDEFTKDYKYDYDVYNIQDVQSRKKLFICQEISPVGILGVKPKTIYRLHQPIDLRLNDEETQIRMID